MNSEIIKTKVNRTNQRMQLRDNRYLGFAEYGSADGYPIVYFHGSQSSRLEMHYDLSFATTHQLRIIAIDRPGHGMSDFNPKGSILEFAQDIKELMGFLKIDRFSVAAMSAGAPFAFGIVHKIPEKINRMAIVSGFAPLTKHHKKALSREIKLMLGVSKLFPKFFALLLCFQAKQITKNPQKVLRSFLKMMSDPDKKILENPAVIMVLQNMFTEAYRNGSKGVSYEVSKILVKDWGFDYSKTQVPISFWQGQKDNNVPFEWAECMANQIEHSSLKTYPNHGHLLIFDHAEEIFSSLKDSVSLN